MAQRISITAVAMSVASLLDATHEVGERGPRTYMARKYLAIWLDTGRGSLRKVIAYRNWLRHVQQG